MGLKHLLSVNIVLLLFGILTRITLGGESLSEMWEYGAWVQLKKFFFFKHCTGAKRYKAIFKKQSSFGSLWGKLLT
jgi:hypothetical protein